MKNLNYPLDFKFKITTFASDFDLTDAAGNHLAYVRSKIFKLKDDVQIFKDDKKSELLFNIKANQWLDFNASFAIKDNTDADLGSVSRKGVKSFWRATYNIFNLDKKEVYNITEENPWIKMLDGFVSEIPLVGMFTGYFLNPSYIVKDNNEKIIYRLKKMPSLFGRRFQLYKIGEVEEQDEALVILSLLMMVLLERRKG